VYVRQDVLYTGSITNTNEYRSCGDMKTYISSVINVAAVEEHPSESRFSAFKRSLLEMFDFSLLKRVAFVPILAAGVLGFFGLYMVVTITN